MGKIKHWSPGDDRSHSSWVHDELGLSVRVVRTDDTEFDLPKPSTVEVDLPMYEIEPGERAREFVEQQWKRQIKQIESGSVDEIVPQVMELQQERDEPMERVVESLAERADSVGLVMDTRQPEYRKWTTIVCADEDADRAVEVLSSTRTVKEARIAGRKWCNGNPDGTHPDVETPDWYLGTTDSPTGDGTPSLSPAVTRVK